MAKILWRVLGILPAAALQILWLGTLFLWLSPYATLINLLMTGAAFFFVLYLMSAQQENTYKTLWLIVILMLPIVGAALYLFFGHNRTSQKLEWKIAEAARRLPPEQSGADPMQCIPEKRLAQTVAHISALSGYPLHTCQDTTYYPLGENAWEDMKAALEQAESYIFVEYFIIEPGVMWDAMVEIMARKVQQGVDVRVLYDDLGSISTMSLENVVALRKLGILCAPFNPVIFLKGAANNRDHRKMLIVDGKVAFSGGINLADEYINAKEKYGHWKDIGFRVTGGTVQSYTRMFASFWNAFQKDKIPDTVFAERPADAPAQGYVLSYYDAPYHNEPISNSLYADLLHQATDTAWFYTPYLMLGDDLRNAFIQAARRGVDVRIIFPGVPDKKLVYRISRSYYRQLLEAGVKIYEYTPGFVHAKACLIDGKIGTIGTVNLDYRSLFLHFENNSLFYDAPILKKLEQDFRNTQQMCTERTAENWQRRLWQILMDGILRFAAPLC